jgi:iron complex transport system ATP-binding protein
MDIAARNIGVEMDSRQIIADISMTAQGHQFIGIIGPNGSGKSTFLKCIYRTLQPTQGIIYLDGQQLTDFSYRESAQKLAVVAQHNFYDFDFEVMEVVLMGRSPHKRLMDRDTEEDHAIAYHSLQTVGMASMAHRSFSTLSGGEQQRVILARALAQRTQCIVLDEPTNHLDIKYQLQLMDIVKGLGILVVAAVHDLNIAAAYCDRLYAIKEGHLFGSGAPDDLLTEQFIYDLYEVRAEILRDSAGRRVIVYHPQQLTGG